MNLEIGPYQVNVEIIKKQNKNTYLRVKENHVISITTSAFTTKKQILKMILENQDYIIKCIEKQDLKQEKNNKFYLWGQPYEIIIDPNLKEVLIDNFIKTPNEETLEKWLKKHIETIYQSHLNHFYKIYQEEIPYPKLRIRKMKTRWGVCNRKNNTITLNSELIRYPIDCLDYVIVHELSHFVHFDHSKQFWLQVAKYFPNYKETRNKLKN